VQHLPARVPLTPPAEGLAKAYEGTKPAVLKRFGETDDRSDELI